MNNKYGVIKMVSIEKLKKSYEEIKPQLDFCQFSKEFESNKLENILNKLAPEEEPQAVLCIGVAKSKGLLSIFSADKFLFVFYKKLHVSIYK